MGAMKSLAARIAASKECQRDRRAYYAAHAPVSIADAVEACGYTANSPAELVNDSVRATVFAVLALLRFEYADQMLAQEEAT